MRCVAKEEEVYSGSIFYFTAIGDIDELEALKDYFESLEGEIND